MLVGASQVSSSARAAGLRGRLFGVAQEQRVWKEKEVLAASKKAGKPADSQTVPDSDKSNGAAGASKSEGDQN